MVERKLEPLTELVSRITRVAYDRSQAPADQMREIRDLINEHKGVYADPYEDNEL
jgi:hypothetical protein